MPQGEKEEGTERVVNIRGNTNIRRGGDALRQSRYLLWPVEDLMMVPERTVTI